MKLLGSEIFIYIITVVCLTPLVIVHLIGVPLPSLHPVRTGARFLKCYFYIITISWGPDLWKESA